MKVNLLSLLVAGVGSAAAFVPLHSRTGSVSSLTLGSTTTAEAEPFVSAAVDGESSDGDDDEIYEKIGFAKDNVALGIDAEAVYTYLGGRDELIQKFMSDVPKWDTERASLEVDKFMMDAEMVNTVIAYQKRRSEARKRGEADFEEGAGEIDPIQEYGTYAAFIGGGVGIAEAKSAFVDHAQAFPFEHFFHSIADKAEVVSGVVDTTVDPSAIQMTVEGAAAAIN